jgi:cystathionine beta-lyase
MGVDVSMQALTKYPSGGADVLMGSVVTRDEVLHHQVLLCHTRLGLGVAANDIELVLRGLPSMAVRYAAQDASTRSLAAWLQTLAHFDQVLHPALPSSPGHAAWRRDCSGAACLLSLAFRPEISQAQVDLFCDSLRLFKLGHSWAGPMSLCAVYQAASIRSLPSAYRGPLVRLAVGLESSEDLRQDLAQAFARAGL